MGERCPNCGKPLMFKAVRCMECGWSRAPLLAFDLFDEPSPDAPTLAGAPWRDRTLGALLPFILSLLWVGIVWLMSGPDSVKTASLLAAVPLRLAGPRIAYGSFKTRLPWLSAGLRNALFAAIGFALALGLAFLIVAPILLADYMGSVWRSFDPFAICRMNQPPPPTPHLSEGLAPRQGPGLVAVTLCVQAFLAVTLPVSVAFARQGLHLPQRTRAWDYLLGVLLSLGLGARWWLPAAQGEAAATLAVALGAVVAILGIRAAGKSERLGLPVKVAAMAASVALGVAAGIGVA